MRAGSDLACHGGDGLASPRVPRRRPTGSESNRLTDPTGELVKLPVGDVVARLQCRAASVVRGISGPERSLR